MTDQAPQSAGFNREITRPNYRLLTAEIHDYISAQYQPVFSAFMMLAESRLFFSAEEKAITFLFHKIFAGAFAFEIFIFSFLKFFAVFPFNQLE
jgi:hypothetical protein